MKILVIEDSKAMRMIILRTLRQAGYTQHAVGEASNATEALQIMQKWVPDLILCDWNMPGMTGIQLLEKLRIARCQIKFGFITSELMPHLRKWATDAGALFVLPKPFSVDDIRAAIEPLLKKP